MKSLRLLASARREYQQLVEFYTSADSAVGADFIAEMKMAFLRIREYPEAFSQEIANYRRCNLSKFPYKIIYRIDPNEIVVFTIRHHSRHPDSWHDLLRG